MERPKYIRAEAGHASISSFDTDIFKVRIMNGVPYQDLIKFGKSIDRKADKDNCLYTIGKCVFPTKYRGIVTNTRWSFVYVAQGNMYINHTILEEGDWRFYPKGVIWSTATKSEECPLYYWCTSNDPFLDEMIAHFGFEKDVVGGHCDNKEAVIKAFERIIYHKHKNTNYRMLFSAAELEILSCVAETNEQSVQNDMYLFERLKQQVESIGGRITVNELAKKYYISRRYLYDVFMENSGRSPQQYILSEKMKTAKNFVRYTNNSITQIADYLKYSDYSHFSRAYSQYYGILPSEDRKQIKAKMTEEERQKNAAKYNLGHEWEIKE